ncbi:MAG: ATP-binding protein [Methylobacter sp.]|nr:ATP-binding protein [Methylobacter sp.]
MKFSIINVEIRYEQDIVHARQRARLIAEMLGFDRQDQIRIGTAVSEIARNTFQYGGGGRAEFLVQDGGSPQVLAIIFRDQGPGIADTEEILAGKFISQTGLGCGIIGARRLMDYFHLETVIGDGTTVYLAKTIPLSKGLITSEIIVQIGEALTQSMKQEPMEEIRGQNQELMQALMELRQKQEDLARMNAELEDTNRGVLALYNELDEKAAQLTEANNLKASFLSYISHEFRTPLNSIVGLSTILMNKMDGELTLEQEKQVGFIHKAADELIGMVSDLLDLAKINSGKLSIDRQEVSIKTLFSSLRGMLKPMLNSDMLNLSFEEAEGLPSLYTDEGKLAQILRNFISNAIKFTVHGEIRIKAQLSLNGRSVIFTVTDTGIGISEQDLSRIFDEYAQVESAQRKSIKGTGLGLSICKKLSDLLGGSVSVKSRLGAGSTFSAVIPVRSPDSGKTPEDADEAVSDIDQYPVLVIDHDKATHALYSEFLSHTDYYLVFAASGQEARELLRHLKPLTIILNILLPEEDSWSFLMELKANPSTRNIPVIIASVLHEENRNLWLDIEDYYIKPLNHNGLLWRLRRLSERIPVNTVMIVDDEEVDLFILKSLLSNEKYRLLKSPPPLQALLLAETEQPDVIFLNLLIPEMSSLEVLDKLKENAATRHIPVIIIASKTLETPEREALNAKVAAILSKNADSGETLKRNILNTLYKAVLENNKPGEKAND